MSGSVRAFVGLWPAPGVAARLGEAQGEMARTPWGAAMRWTPIEKAHLTMLFLGQVERSLLPHLVAALSEACSATAPFEVSCQGLGCFPSPRRPSVLWAGVATSAALLSLHHEIVERAGSYGDHRDEKAFRPHITMARVKRLDAVLIPRMADDLERWSQVSFGAWEVNSVSLVDSRLQPSGPQYLDIESFRLRGG